MFQWASDTFDKLSQTVAPPPTDAAGRFSYAVSRLDENTAMGCIAEIDPLRTVVNQSKGWFPIHMACQYSMTRLIRLLMNQPGFSIEQPDYTGCTPLHHACMSTQRSTGLEVVKTLIKEYNADPCAKNSSGQTPYDVATLDSIRQYILPIQLQKETQYALDNGGQGLPPGIDLGGLKINRSNMAPPPKFGSPGVAPPAGHMTAAPGQSRYPQTPGMAPSQGRQPIPAAQPIARAPASMPGRSSIAGSSARSQSEGGGSKYARSGGSHLAMYSKYKADGFHSSTSDVNLQKKYGHVGANTGSDVPPPPSSGNAPLSGNGAHVPAGPNPFSGGGNLVGISRYASYGQTTSAPAPVSGPMYSGMGSAQATPKFFTPGATTAASAAPTTPMPTPSTVGPTSPFMPPPPYSGAVTAETNTVADSPAVMAPPASMASPFATSRSDAASNLFESPPNTSETTEAVASNTTVEVAEQQNDSGITEAQETSSVNDTSSDWVDAVDPASGKTYYFNYKTNETSWEKPDTVTAGEETATNPTTIAEEDTNTDGDWTEVVDPSSGNIYYYNSTTGETSWDKPSSETLDDGNTETVTPDKDTSQENEWEEATDPSSGNTYYFNSVTGETSWERPPSLSEQKPSEQKPLSSDDVAPTENVVKDTDASDIASQNDAITVGEEDKAQGDETPFGEETDSSLLVEEEESNAVEGEKTECDTPAETTITEDNGIMEKETTTETDDGENSSDNLPDGWIEATDPSSGKVYYCNMDTQETSWDRPVASGGTTAGGESKEAGENDTGNTVSDDRRALDVVGDLPKGWEELQDPSTGNNYYYNTETQETSWEKPRSIEMDTTSSPTEEESDWVETLDQSSGKNYYYNTVTGETSWEKPDSLNVQESVFTTDTTANTSTETPSVESKPTSAADAFVQDDKPQSTPLAKGLERTMSAEEMFSSPPGDVRSNGTSSSSANGLRSPIEATLGSVVATSAEDLFSGNASNSTPAKLPDSTTAEELFGTNSADTTPAKLMESTAAADLFKSNSEEPAPANNSESTVEESEPLSSQEVKDLNESDEEDMTEIPLTPAPETVVKSTADMPTIPSTSNAEPTPTAAVRQDLFAAIGMPPPPFQSRR